MIPEKTINKIALWVQWIVATIVATLTGLTYIHSYVYPRAEAQALERKIESVETDTKLDMKELRQKIDTMYTLLITLERRSRRFNE